ncbi:hypothetical protein KVV02_000254 [Mortierella alpina]|uniref:Uncharacterized protein n=1 Tax=Mortierella alpina TaxID=64518 RepID=A0A9P8D3N2_MORAP|nr:hypothetical protein KVV02_000254 [Mortierella alpina]
MSKLFLSAFEPCAGRCRLTPVPDTLTRSTTWTKAERQCKRISLHNTFSSSTAKQADRPIGLQSSRDHRAGAKPGRDTGNSPTRFLRKAVMDEVAIPGKYQIYFKPDKRATRKAEGADIVDRKRSPKKIAAAKWNRSSDREESGTDDHSELRDFADTISPVPSQTSPGFDNVARRALEQVMAREVLPHPYFNQDYLDITEIKLLPDRKTFQLWYRPRANETVSADQICNVVLKHAAAFKAMLARHARSSSSSKLTFQLVRQSDRQANMTEIWKKLEEEAHLHEDIEAEEHSTNARRMK